MINFIDPSAHVHSTAKVWHFAVVRENVILSEGVSIGSGSEIGQSSVIGPGSRISAHVFLPANSNIGFRVFIGPGVTFTDDRYPKAGNSDYLAEPPEVRDGASIGAGSVILPGIVIGEGAMIGAGSVITQNVPAGAKVYGPRARLVPQRDNTPPPLFAPALLDESGGDDLPYQDKVKA